jgi:alkaline phosphatase D
MRIRNPQEGHCWSRAIRRALGGLVIFLATPICSQAIAQSSYDFFPNGVAAGDVDQDSAVLWARSAVLSKVLFEYGTVDEYGCFTNSKKIVKEVTDVMIPAKVEIDGLTAGTRYHYRACLINEKDGTDKEGDVHCPRDRARDRARDGGRDRGRRAVRESPNRQRCEPSIYESRGEFSTPHIEGHHGLKFGVSSCSDQDLRPFASIQNVREQNLHFFVHLGDSIYADHSAAADPACHAEDIKKNASDLADFRCWHNALYSQRNGSRNVMAEARASTAFFATIDDHEVRDNFVGNEGPQNNQSFLYTRGLQAFLEYNPIQQDLRYAKSDCEESSDCGRFKDRPKLYRYRTFGKDAAVFIVDARSFRDKAPAWRKRYREDSTMLGKSQLRILKADLKRAESSGITWKFVMLPEPIQNLGRVNGPDRFEGYARERAELLDLIENHPINNVVFISGDIHGTIVNNLIYEKQGLFKRLINRYTHSWEISTGPVAYIAPYAPNLVSLRRFDDPYFELSLKEQDMCAEKRQNLRTTLRFPRVGLCGGGIDADLLEGTYMAANSYGWTEFEVADNARKVTVTTWGIPWYDLGLERRENQMPFLRPPSAGPEFDPRDPDAILALRVPEVVSKFEVYSSTYAAGAANRGNSRDRACDYLPQGNACR